MNWPGGHGPLTALHAVPSFTSEYVVRPLQGPHTRLTISDPAVVCPSPLGHFRHATQTSLPLVALNVPAAHVAHWRSDDAPNANASYWPAWHSVTAWQMRSDVAVGAATVKCPVLQSLCVLQSRSLETVGATFSYSVAEHTVTGLHASPLLLGEYVYPSTQGVHTRSETAVPACTMPAPTGHVAQASHDMRPDMVVKVPELQAAHVRSLLEVASAMVYEPAAQDGLTALHASPLVDTENV